MTTKYFDVDGVPGEWPSDNLPRLFVKGAWRQCYDIERFANNACPITKEQFDRLMAENQASGQG